MQPADAMNNPEAQERALQKIEQALALLRDARAEQHAWAPPSAINDLQAAESVLEALPARLPERDPR